MLWACLLLPSLPLDVFARGHSPADAAKPFAVTTGGRTPRIVGANAAACDAGVCPGQLVSASFAFSPDLALRERSMEAESAALKTVASWATQFTPVVALAPPDAVLIEIGGSLRLFGGLSRLTARLAHGARDLGYDARLALAPTSAAALLFAKAEKEAEKGARLDFYRTPKGKTNEVRKIEPGPFFDMLAPLPLSLAEADPAAVAMLEAAGIETFGQAFALPRAALARRAGEDFVALLDRVRGLAPDLRPTFVPPPRYAGKLDLPAPVTDVDALAFAVNRLVLELAGWLAGRGLGVAEMSLALAHERYIGITTGVAATTVRFALAAPAREPAHLIGVLRERLARVVLPAPVETITLATMATSPLSGRNLGLLPGDDAAATVPLIDRLRARLGESAVTLVAPHAEHRPEYAWRERKVELDKGSGSRSPRGGRKKARETFAADSAGVAPRPVWLLAEQESLGDRLEAQPWVLRDGPERIESGWWDGADVRRDYFIAENPRGETVWIYRDHRYGIDDGEWFLHGVFS